MLFSIVTVALAFPQVAVDKTPSHQLFREPLSETFGVGTPGTLGLPRLRMSGIPALGQPFALVVENANPLSTGVLLTGIDDAPVLVPAFDAVLYPSQPLSLSPFGLDAAGGATLLARAAVGPNAVGRRLVAQAVIADATATGGYAFTKAVRIHFGDGTLHAPLGSALMDESPVRLTSGDFNGDGRSDLALLESFGSVLNPSTRLKTLLARADGTFAPGISTTVANHAVFFLTAGDVDDDGIIDLVVGDDVVGRLSTFLGAGDGTFPVRQNSPLGAVGASVRHVELGDVDGDGFLDAAVADTPGEQVHVLLGLGDGLFALDASYPALPGSSDNVYEVLIEDFDADGFPDLMAAMAGSRVRYLRGLGNGSFASGVDYPVAGMQARTLLAGDFNLDGDSDVAVCSFGSGVLSLLQGNGDGTFAAGVTLSNCGLALDLAGGDFNGDGALDFAALCEGDGTTEIWLAAPAGPQLHSLTACPIGTQDVLSADFDGDGLADLALGSESEGMVALAGNGDGTFAASKRLDSDEPVLAGVAVGDFDGDQVEDLAIVGASGANALHVYRGSASLQFTQVTLPPNLTSTVGPSLVGVYAADLDLDGDDDLLVAGDTGLSILLAGDSGLVHASTALAGQRASIVRFGDLNGDRLPDLLATSLPNSGDLFALLGQGDGSFVSVPLSVGIPVRAVALGDIDSDGVVDAALGTNTGVELVFGNGDGTFSVPTSLSVGRSFRLELADLNGDGLLDLVRHDGGIGTPVRVQLATVPGSFSGSQNLSTPPNRTSEFTVGDLNRDGTPDLVLGYQGGLRLYRNKGDGSFEVAGAFATPGRPESLLLRDLDHDLLPDLITLDALDGVFLQSNQTLR